MPYLGDAGETLQVRERLHKAHQELGVERIFVNSPLKCIHCLLPILRDIVGDPERVPVLGL